MDYPYVSLVVVNYNGADILEKCLPSLFSIDYPKDKYEVIVVDNASHDTSMDVIKKFKDVRVISNDKNMGYVGVNSCLDSVKGTYIFVLNNDLEMEKNCVKEMVALFEKHDDVGVVVPKFVNYFDRKLESSGTWVSRSFYTGHYTDPDEKQHVKEVPYLGIEMIRTSLAKKFGYIYDPDYFIYGEDLDLSLRFRLLGYKTLYVPSAIIFHMHARTTKKSASHEMTFLLERNLLMTFFKVLGIGHVLLFLPYVLLIRVLAFCKDCIFFRFMNAFARIRALFWIFFHVGLIVEKRRMIQRMRTKSDSFVLHIFSEKHLFSRKSVLL